MIGVDVVPRSKVTFSTRALAGPDRLGIWREVFGRQLARLDIAPVEPDRPFEAEVSILNLGDLSVSYGTNRGVRSTRTRELIKDGRSDLLIGWVAKGRVHVGQRGKETTLTKGQATIMWGGAENVAVAPNIASLFNVGISYSEISARIPDIEERCAQAIPSDNIALQLLRTYVRKLFTQEAGLSVEFMRTAVVHITDLAALALGASGANAEEASLRGLRFGRLTAVKDRMARNLGDPDLSTERLAGELSVSVSYVRRLFEEEGTTPNEYLLGIRLEAAHRILEDGGERTISSIAFEVGFNDLSYFNRTFRRRYGATPSEVRDRSRAMELPGLNPPAKPD